MNCGTMRFSRMTPTGSDQQIGNTWDLYSRGARFKSRRGHQLFCFVYILRPSQSSILTASLHDRTNMTPKLAVTQDYH